MQDTTTEPNPYQGDEIDLFELFEGLWARKWLICGITGVSILLGLAYVLIASPTYQASAQVRPADISDLARINETGIFELKPDEAFRRGLNELESQRVRKLTHEAMAVEIGKLSPARNDWSWRDFSENITLNLPKTNKGAMQTKDYAVVAFQDSDSAFSAHSVNILVEMANQTAVDKLVGELRFSLEARVSLLEDKIKQEVELETQSNLDQITRLEEDDDLQRLQIKDEIDALREKNQRLRKDEILALEEALGIAKNLGIEEPVTLAQMNNQGRGSQANFAIEADFSDSEDPLYLRGTRMLKAEIAALKARTSDDFTSPEVRDLEEELARLAHNRQVELLRARKDNTAFVDGIHDMRSEMTKLKGYLEADYSSVRLLNLDQPAEPPEDPIKPKKTLTVLLCAVGGGFLGMLVALINYAAAQRRKYR